MKRLPPLLLAALLVAAAPAAAQDFDDPISTDRPGLGTEMSVVAPGRVQIEVGTPSVARGMFDEIRRLRTMESSRPKSSSVRHPLRRLKSGWR